MAKKVDQEAADQRCTALLAEATRAEADRDYRTVLQRTEESLLHLRDMIAYRRRYLGVERPPLPTVDLLLKYAPPLFASRSLDAVAEWIAAGKKAERELYPHLPDQLNAARRAMAAAAKLWSACETATPVPAGVDRTTVASVAGVWVHLGAVARNPRPGDVPYTLVSHPKRGVVGKCPRCGRPHEATWQALLEPAVCPSCKQVGTFTILKRVI